MFDSLRPCVRSSTSVFRVSKQQRRFRGYGVAMIDRPKTLQEAADDINRELRALGKSIVKEFRIDVLCDFLSALIQKLTRWAGRT